MEPLNQKSLERVLSQKALQFGNSFPCQICVAGFLCGVYLTTMFLAALTSLGTFQFGTGISFSGISVGNSPWISLYLLLVLQIFSFCLMFRLESATRKY